MRFLRGIITTGVRNPILVNLLMWCLVAGGIVAGRSMVRESFPQVFLDHIAVEVAYPGASAEDVEQSICVPIEEAVAGVAGVNQVSSSANENIGSVWLGLRSNVRDVDAVLKEVKDRIDQLTTLPRDAKKPVVSEKVIRTEAINIAIHGDAPERTLKRLAQEVRDDLLTGGEVSQVSLLGVREDEIIIELSAEALQAYNLSLTQVMGMVSQSSVNLPAGVIRTLHEELTLRVVGQRYTAAEYEDLAILEHDGATVRLRDLATVREGFEETNVRGRFNGERAAVVAIYKTPEEDTTRISRVVREYVASRQATLPERLHLSVWGDASTDIASRTNLLYSNGLMGIVLLFITLTVFLGFKYAFWVAADIPLCFAGALILMYYFGQSLNMVSLFALIIVAGIVVDDSIVIAEAVHSRRKAGLSAADAAIEGTYSVSMPVVAATLTTVISFVPLMYISGIMGRFVEPIPIVIIAALVASTVDAFFILPSHLCHSEREVKEGQGIGQTRFRRWIDGVLDAVVVKLYRPAYRWAINARYITIAIAVAALLASVGVVWGGRLPFVLLPKEDGKILRARVRFAEGTPASSAQEAIEQIERAAWALNDDPALKPSSPGALVKQVYSIAGEFVDFHSIRGSNLCEVRMELMDPELRILDDDRIIDRWRTHIGALADAPQLTLARQQIGPTEQPIEIRLLGNNLEDLASASQKIQDRLREFGGILDVHDDLIPGKRELRVKLLPNARALGLTVDDVGRQLRYGFYGGEAVKVRRGRDEVTVRVRFPDDERRSVSDLETLLLSTPSGHQVPFREVAQIERGRGYAQIMHQDNRRRVRVFADVDDRVANAEQILQTLEAGFLQETIGEFDGMNFTLGGDRHAVKESLGSLANGFWIGLVVMYTMLAAMLRSYIQPLVIFLTVPFGCIGAIIGHFVLGYDLTMMSLFGLVALSGIVVDHAIIVLDAAHELIRGGKSLMEAMYQAGELRFNAVVLSAITDVAGLLPLLSRPHGQAQSVMPMAIAFSFGLVFSALITLFLVPAVYVALNDARRFVHWVRRGGEYPTAEMVEESSEHAHAATA